jgi:hypothetical protein
MLIGAAYMLWVGHTLHYSDLPLVLGVSRLASASTAAIAFHTIYQGIVTRCVVLIAFIRAVSRLGSRSGNRAIIAFLPAVAALLAVPSLMKFLRPSNVLRSGSLSVARCSQQAATPGQIECLDSRRLRTVHFRRR